MYFFSVRLFIISFIYLFIGLVVTCVVCINYVLAKSSFLDVSFFDSFQLSASTWTRMSHILPASHYALF